MRAFVVLAVLLLVETVLVIGIDPHKRRPKKFKKFSFRKKNSFKAFTDPHKVFDPHKFYFPHEFGVPHKINDPHKFDDPHQFVKPHSIHDPHKFNDFPSKSAVAKFLAQVVKIEAGTRTEIQQTSTLLELQDDFEADFETAFNNQAQIDEGIGDVGTLVSETKNNTAANLGQVDAVLAGQAAIKKLAGKEGAETRRAVKGLITATADEFETIASIQAAILAKIEQGRSKAVKSFQALFASQGQSQSQLGALVQAIENASAANLDGQAKITNAVQDSRQEIQNDLAKVFSRQGSILKSLDNSQAKVEKRIDAVFGRQQVIIQSTRASQGVVQSDLNGLKKEQGRTQNTVRQAQSAIQTEIGVVTKQESVTQHILVKCKNDCDLKRVVDGIFHIKKQVVSIENNLLREVRGVSSSELKTQNALAGAEANILRELDANSDDTLHELNAFGELLHHLLADCENDIKTLNKDVIIVGNAQDHIEHALKKIHQDLDRLTFPNVYLGKSGFRKFH